jgi:tetratricopeptide (TPR) repeat protein
MLSLADAELIYARGLPPQANYRFKHALIQDAAYEALLKSRRRELHAAVARTIYTGDLQAVEEHYERLSPLIDNLGEKQAPGNNIVAIGVASFTAWVLGRFDSAHQRMARAFAFAQKSKDPYDLAMALHFLANLYASAERDSDRTEETAAQLLALSEKNGFSYAASLALGPLGWARAQKGAGRESAASMRKALVDQVASGARVSICLWLNRLAEVEALSATSKALTTIEEALTANPQERIYRPQSLTIRGTLKHQLGEDASAEADFREAMRLAQAMGAKAFELRAATALARLLQTRCDPVAARGVLAPVYAWFTEGHDLSDLKDARALLDQLGE